MNRLRIIHETIYRYSRPVEFGPHRLVLRPREGHDLRVEEMNLELEPDYELEWSWDIFGNSVATAFFFAPARTLRIKNTLLLQRISPFSRRVPEALLRPHYPLEFSSLERRIIEAYRDPIYPDDAVAITDWLNAEIVATKFDHADVLAAALNEKIYRSLQYRLREEKGVQTPRETLARGSGSCRDLATLLLECWRVLGFPARFASGYLDCAASEAGIASTHAWAEVYLPEIGWVGFDPTLGAFTSEQHVVTGVSNHPRGAMPITGTFYGERAVYEGMEVTVKTESLGAREEVWQP
jgi:transglutaminase-like putative cysteine protease